MHILENHQESQPPQGGIFLSNEEYQYASGLLERLPEIEERSVWARKKLDALIPIPSGSSSGPREDIQLQRDQEHKLLYVRQASHDAIAYRTTLIDAQDWTDAQKKRAKNILKKDTREVNQTELAELKAYLASPESQAKLKEKGIVPEHMPVHPWVSNIQEYCESLKSEAGHLQDVLTTLRRISESLMQRCVDQCLETGVEHFTYNGQMYVIVCEVPSIQPFAITWDEASKRTVMFTNAMLEASEQSRWAGTDDYIQFLQTCLNNPHGLSVFQYANRYGIV